LEDIDEKRRKEFKNYELEKEHLRRKELEQMDEVKRAEAEKKHDEQKKKHADHPKLHHPVSQLVRQWRWPSQTTSPGESVSETVALAVPNCITR